MLPTVAEIIYLLDLEVHPTCGYVAETYRSKQNIPREALPNTYDSARPFGSVLYFLVTREANIRVHRIRFDQMYHHYLGDPLEVRLLYPDGSGRIATVGPDLRIGMRPQLFIPGGTFRVARLKPGSSYALIGTTEWPGVEPSDVGLGSREKLIEAYPELREEISAFTDRVH
jgi:predicted cupin superfamily sugar epimerase